MKLWKIFLNYFFRFIFRFCWKNMALTNETSRYKIYFRDFFDYRNKKPIIIIFNFFDYRNKKPIIIIFNFFFRFKNKKLSFKNLIYYFGLSLTRLNCGVLIVVLSSSWVLGKTSDSGKNWTSFSWTPLFAKIGYITSMLRISDKSSSVLSYPLPDA